MTLDDGATLCYMCFIVVLQIGMCDVVTCASFLRNATKKSRCIFQVTKYRVASSLPIAVVMHYLITNAFDVLEMITLRNQ